MLIDHLLKLLSDVYGGRRWIITTDALAGATRLVQPLEAWGATGLLVVAGTQGTGALPTSPLAAPPIVLDVQAASSTESIRRTLEATAHLAPEHVAQVDAFDPEGTAEALGSILDDGRPVAGRRKFGARPRAWQLLEDKTANPPLWDAIGAPQAPWEVVEATLPALQAAARRMDRGAGTVQAGDAREGFNGGAEYVRWVRDEAAQAEAAAFFAARCDSVRVMPFLEGIPCSVHGIVFPDYTAVLRPCEMLVFRCPGTSRFHYGRAATFWDPAPADREAMRDTARRLGEHLRASVGYRGAFTLDGILTADGFMPTELNPRFGAALGMINLAVPELPLMLLNLALVEGVEVDWRPREVEALLLERADAQRAGSTMAMTSTLQTGNVTLRLALDDTGWREVPEGAPADATLTFGPAATGGIVFAAFDPSRTPVGPPLAPRAVSLLAWADARLGLGLGPLEPAQDVRRAD